MGYLIYVYEETVIPTLPIAYSISHSNLLRIITGCIKYYKGKVIIEHVGTGFFNAVISISNKRIVIIKRRDK